MAVFLIITAFSLGKFNFLNTIDNKALIFIILSGISGAISWLFYFLAIKTGPVTAVAAIDRTSIVFVFVLSVLFLSESLTVLKSIGALAIVIGAILMAI
jgi:transporter family protein